jgi:uncharacterized protein YxeA
MRKVVAIVLIVIAVILLAISIGLAIYIRYTKANAFVTLGKVVKSEQRGKSYLTTVEYKTKNGKKRAPLYATNKMKTRETVKVVCSKSGKGEHKSGVYNTVYLLENYKNFMKGFTVIALATLIIAIALAVVSIVLIIK